eukprot:PITA_36593
MLARPLNLSELQHPGDDVQIYEISLNETESRYVDIIFYFKNGYAPTQLNYTKKRALRLKSRQYQIVDDVPFRINYDYVLLRCLEKSEAEKVLQELHDGPVGGNFEGNALIEFSLKRGFKLKYSTNYYLQGNGLEESTNKNLIRIIKRTVDQGQKNWHNSLVFSLWVDRITQKASIGTSPFNLVYGKEVALPTNIDIPSLALVQFIKETPSSYMQVRNLQTLKLEEEKEKAMTTHAHH